MSFEIERGERNASEYPYYGEYDSIIVLFTDISRGIVVASNNEKVAVGMSSSSWDEYKFKKLNTGDRIIIDIEG